MPPSVSLCLIVRNEEAHLPACLAPVKELVQEIVVVDTGSTDGSRAMARWLGARVLDFAGEDDAAAARNEAMRHARGDWILSLDARDRLDEVSRARLRRLLAELGDEDAAYVMKCIRKQPHMLVEENQVRLFRKHPETFWQGRTHEQVQRSLERRGVPLRHTEVVIQQLSGRDPGLDYGLSENGSSPRSAPEELPDDAATLFHLGWAYQGMGRAAEALPILQRSLERCDQRSALLPRIHRQLARAHQQLGQMPQAVAVCRQGRECFPDDPELLLLEGCLLYVLRDLAGAEVSLKQMVTQTAKVEDGAGSTPLLGVKARHNLAIVYRDQGRFAEAEEQWRTALREQPGLDDARLGLGELLLAQGHLTEAEMEVAALRGEPRRQLEGALLQARILMARREWQPARQRLEEIIARAPQALPPRLRLAQLLVEEGSDRAAAEKAVQEVLARAPQHPEGLRLLERLPTLPPAPPVVEVESVSSGAVAPDADVHPTTVTTGGSPVVSVAATGEPPVATMETLAGTGTEPAPAPAVADIAEEQKATGGELASILILCCNQLDYTRLCLESVLRHTRSPYELILVDNGSSDGTAAYLEALRTTPGPERVEVIRNERNAGVAAGCNQALAAARGEYLVFLHNDTIVTEGWLERLIAWSLSDAPVGLVGAVTSFGRAPQQVASTYRSLEELPAFAAQRAREYAGRSTRVTQLAGFCLLARRAVLEKVGGFDERFGIGFFEEDDLCLRISQAGFHLLLAQDVFVHHFGSRTFRGLGINCREQLARNLDVFRAKWGAEHSAGYVQPGQVAARPAAPLRPRVSLCMIVRNEEASLPACLDSVAGLFDEIVIVDTGSADRTADLARRLGARVVTFPWCDDFAAARNEGLRHASGQWIFWLDAGDRLDAANRGKLQKLLAELPGDNAVYLFKCLCLESTAAGTASVVEQCRLFRRLPGLRWEYRVFEQVLPSAQRLGCAIRAADVIVQHTGSQDPVRRRHKIERYLELVLLDAAERPGDALVQFNLGWTYQKLGRYVDSMAPLLRSLEHVDPQAPLAAKLHALLARAYLQMGRGQEALGICRVGLRRYPEDLELLLHEGLALQEAGDLKGAEQRLRQLLEGTAQAPPATALEVGLHRHMARHHLALILRAQRRTQEAEMQWRQAVEEKPDFTAGWVALADEYLARGNRAELEMLLRRLHADPRRMIEAAVVQARVDLARGEFVTARRWLDDAIRRAPQALWPRMTLSHALLLEGTDWAAAETALKAVLALDPGNGEALHNLTLLQMRQNRLETSSPRV